MYKDITKDTVLNRGSWIQNKNDKQGYEVGEFQPSLKGYEVIYNGKSHLSTGVLFFVRIDDLIENYQLRAW